MEKTLLGIGIGCVIAAIVGGGLKAFGMEFPLVNSTERQLALGIFGFFMMAAYFVPAIRRHSGEPEIAPKKTPADPARVLPQLAFGTWTLRKAIDDGGKDFCNSTLKFNSQEETSDGLALRGAFTWRLNDVLLGSENFTGHYFHSSRQIIFEGDSVVDVPHSSERLAVGSDSAVLAADERTLVDGRWGASMQSEPGVSGCWEAAR